MSTEGVAVVEKILIAVVGDSGCGKSSLVRALSPPRQSSNEENDTLVDGVCKELLLKTKDGLGIHVRDTLEGSCFAALLRGVISKILLWVQRLHRRHLRGVMWHS